ncbi:hypothetical protein [Parafrankia discariae]|uniref:hypothetical protein n=1 Tax=Parafrankia discariae TaxID=365528 RepID=UPI0012B68AEC|nr:hypothetical protein [Parafrankia discariae]
MMFNKAAYQRVVWPPLPDDERAAAPVGPPHAYGAPGHGQPPSGGARRRSSWRIFGPFAGESFFGMKTTISCGLLGLGGGITLMVGYFSDGQVRDGLICLLLAALSALTLVITEFGRVRDALPGPRKALAALGLACPLLVVAFVALHVVVLLVAVVLPLLFLRLLLFSGGGGSGSSDPFRYVEALDNPARYKQRQERGY